MSLTSQTLRMMTLIAELSPLEGRQCNYFIVYSIWQAKRCVAGKRDNGCEKMEMRQERRVKGHLCCPPPPPSLILRKSNARKKHDADMIYYASGTQQMDQ